MSYRGTMPAPDAAPTVGRVTQPPAAPTRLGIGDVGWGLFWGAIALVGGAAGGLKAWSVALGLATVGLLVVRRVRPRASAVGLLLVCVAYALTSGAALTISPIVAAAALAHLSRRHLPPAWRSVVPVVLTAGVVGYLLVGSPTLRAAPLATRMPLFGWALGLLLIAGLVGELGRRSAEEAAREVDRLTLQLTLQREEMELRALEQRTFLAREVHDLVAHTLSTIVAQADGARYTPDLRPQAARDVLATIARVGRTSLRQTRGIVEVLRDGTPRETTPVVGVDDLPDLLEDVRAAGLPIDATAAGTPPPHLPDDISLAVYRIVQESLTNVRRHSAAAAALVALEWDRDAVRVRIDDDGPPVVASEPGVDVAGHGLAGLGERARAAGGELLAGPHGRGWSVRAQIPLEEDWWTA